MKPLYALCVLVAGCAGMGERPVPPAEADRIAVYESVPAPRPYRLVKRVWVEKWISAFTVPTYGSVEEGTRDLQAQAVALGGDAVMNFGCYRRDPDTPHSLHPGLVCNGNVIKYLQ